MSLITVQSTTARFRHPGLPPVATAEFAEIGALSRQALDEMRGLLTVLRGDEEASPRQPQPHLADVRELVGQAERAGVMVTFALLPADDERLVGDVTGLAAYRIVQEALSNAIRHAPGAAVAVRSERAGDRLVITVVNERPEVMRPPRPDPGHGLIGMTERAVSVGGTVTAAPTQDGGFAVRAVLPLRPLPGEPR